jgi:hypothetical protein
MCEYVCGCVWLKGKRRASKSLSLVSVPITGLRSTKKIKTAEKVSPIAKSSTPMVTKLKGIQEGDFFLLRVVPSFTLCMP